MPECRYIPNSLLPAEASASEIDAIVSALTQGRYRLSGVAYRYVVGPWEMTTRSFIGAILDHLNAGRCLFHKTVANPPPDTLLFDANIALDFETDDEERDVYVEIRLSEQVFITICDAHTHTRGQARLPKLKP